MNSKNIKSKISKEEKIASHGITLIALVITIIILIILAGVSINIIIKEDGIMQKARIASKATKEADIVEQVKLKILEKQVDDEKITKSIIMDIICEYGTPKIENGKLVALVTDDGIEISIDKLYDGNIEIYEINNKEELEKFRDAVNAGDTFEGKIVALMADIDLQGNENDSTTWWTPIGLKSGTPFCGKFYGNNHTVSNMYLYGETSKGDALAFFGYIQNSTIKDFTITGTAVNIENSGIGGIIALANGITTIDHCNNKVNITNKSTAYCSGGIVTLSAMYEFEDISYTKITISNCSNLGNINAQENAGGIIGYSNGNVDLVISNCVNYGNIEAKKNASGLMPNSNGIKKVEIENCENKGVITGNLVGGAIAKGKAEKINIDSFVNSNKLITTQNQIGGIIGNVYGTDEIFISNSKNIANIEHDLDETVHCCPDTGGLIGYIGKGKVVIYNSYNSGEIIAQSREAGGLIGHTAANAYLINVFNIGNCSVGNNPISEWTGVCATAGGLISIMSESNNETQIINSYNYGDVFGDNRTLGIGPYVRGKENQKLIIRNSYNSGVLTYNNTEKFGVAKINENNTADLLNTYYLDDASSGTNLENDKTTKLTETYMKSQAFVDVLNEYVKDNPIYTIDNMNIQLKTWKMGTDGYPVFE